MGLYDGYVRMHGSSAEVAKTVGIPTVLLVDARSSAYSVGALLYGFKHFRQDTEVIGVVFNRVASENHYRFLREAAEDAGVIPLGYIPKTKLLEVPFAPPWALTPRAAGAGCAPRRCGSAHREAR